MRKFEMELDEEHLASIGKITVNFATLDLMLSFFIWNMLELNQGFVEGLATLPRSEQGLWVEFYT